MRNEFKHPRKIENVYVLGKIHLFIQSTFFILKKI